MTAFYRLNASWRVGEPMAAQLAAFGWQGIRVETPQVLRDALRVNPRDEIARDATLAHYEAVKDECCIYGWTPLHIIEREEADLIPAESEVQYLCEPDIGTWRKLSAQQYRDELLSILPALLDRGCIVYAGSVCNMSEDNRAYMETVFRGLPSGVFPCWHRYPDGDQVRTTPKRGMKSRQDELAKFQAATGNRPFAIAEFGFQGEPYKYRTWSLWKYFGKLVSRSDDWVADTTAEECRFWRDAGAQFVALYRLQRGHGGFGLTNADGTWKPVARVPQR